MKGIDCRVGEIVLLDGKPFRPPGAAPLDTPAAVVNALHGSVSDECVAHYEAGKKFGHRAGFEEAMALKPDWSGNWLGGLLLAVLMIFSAAIGFAAGRTW